jgi:hypothetical protein
MPKSTNMQSAQEVQDNKELKIANKSLSFGNSLCAWWEGRGEGGDKGIEEDKVCF